ncbi:MAG: response regulator [Elusimicrobia bacterium]|nr:response regulator [Elusimicrobiota bacterium]MBU2613995.1 response regulator [Elusimicrobiota bacterium]
MAKKILIAENEWELRNLLKLIIEKYDFDVMEAEDDRQAVNLVSSFKPDLLMLDLSMKGFEIVHKLRNNYETQSLPVVMLIDKKAIQDSPIKDYVQDFLLKPFEEESVLQVIKKIFGDVQKKTAASKRPFDSFFTPDSEKTVVLSPSELPAEASMGEKTLVLSPEEIMAITKQSVKPVIPETFSPELTIQVNPLPEVEVPEPIAQEPVQEEQIPEPAPEIPGASVPEFMPEATIQGTDFEKLFGKSQEEKVPEPIVVETKFYSILNVTLKDLLLAVYCSVRLSGNKDISDKPILVVTNGSDVDSKEFGTIMDVFGSGTNVVAIDAGKFNDKIQELTAAGVIIFEVDPSGFKKIR